MTFQLDRRLANDCYQMAENEHSLWLLLNNSYFPWFIVVPKATCTELYQLTKEQQDRLQNETNLISEFVSRHFPCDKLNVASIGNIVAQMHVHVIARTKTDPCWPGVVWGTDNKAPYPIAEVLNIQTKLQQFCQAKNITGYHFTAPDLKLG
jgi:diadenosine tetraphosphate (Ap4A) HIT family hydrolase